GKAVSFGFRLSRSAAEAEQLPYLPPILFAVSVICQERIEKIYLSRLGARIMGVRKKWRHSPHPLRFFLFAIEQRAEHLGSIAGRKCQVKVVVQESRITEFLCLSDLEHEANNQS